MIKTIWFTQSVDHLVVLKGNYKEEVNNVKNILEIANLSSLIVT